MNLNNNLNLNNFNSFFFMSNSIFSDSTKRYKFKNKIKGLDNNIDPSDFTFQDLKLLNRYSSTLGLTRLDFHTKWAGITQLAIYSLPVLIEKHALVRLVQRTNATNKDILDTFECVMDSYNLMGAASLFEGFKTVIPTNYGVFLGEFECIDSSSILDTVSMRLNNRGIILSESRLKTNFSVDNFIYVLRIKTFIPYEYCTLLQFVLARLIIKCIEKHYEVNDSSSETSQNIITLLSKIAKGVNFSPKFIFNEDLFGGHIDFDRDYYSNLSIDELHNLISDELAD